MTKYYYKGQLVRTSKTHDNYKYCLVIDNGDGTYRVKACSATAAGAGRDYNYWANRYKGFYNKNTGNPVQVYVDELDKVSA